MVIGTMRCREAMIDRGLKEAWGSGPRGPGPRQLVKKIGILNKFDDVALFKPNGRVIYHPLAERSCNRSPMHRENRPAHALMPPFLITK
jgi:hypothetical protein